MNENQTRLENPVALRILLGFISANILLNYLFLQYIYRPHNIDDPASLFLAYNYVVNGNALDTVFVGPDNDPVGVIFFRKTYALLYGHILSGLGWTYAKAQMISAAFVFLAGVFWFLAMKKMGYGNTFRIVFLALFFYLEFSFMAATSLRQEAMELFFQSFGLYLFLSRRYFLAGMVYAIAIESHPMGLLHLAYPLAWTMTHTSESDNSRRTLFIMSGGLVAGVCYYFWLHPVSIPDLTRFLSANTGRTEKESILHLGALGNYFFLSKYYRHLPELALLMFSLYILFVRKIYKEQMFLLLTFAFLLVISFLRDNSFYTILIYPVFIFIILTAFTAMRRENLLLFLTILLMAPQYFYVYHLNAGWDRNSYFSNVKQLAPENDLPLVGNAMTWFALMERSNFKSALYPKESFAKQELPEFYLLEDRFLHENTKYSYLLNYISAHYQGATVRTVGTANSTIILKKMVKRDGN